MRVALAARLTLVLLLLCAATISLAEEAAGALPGTAPDAVLHESQTQDESPIAEGDGDKNLDGLGIATHASAADGSDLIMYAMGLLGTPYRRGGHSPATGFDCSGLVGHVFRQVRGIVLPRSSRDVYALPAHAAERIARENLLAGDLLFFRIGRLGRRIDHVGFYLGDGRMLHAPASGGEVRIESLELPYWKRHYAGARRILLAGKPGLSQGGDNAGRSAADAAAADFPVTTTEERSASDVVARDLGEFTVPLDEETEDNGDDTP